MPENNLNNESSNTSFFAAHKKLILKMLGLLLILVLLILGIVWTQNAFKRYRNTEKYKVAYDISVAQLKFCQSPKVNSGEDPTVIVHYCDELKKRFDTVNIDEGKK